MNTDLELVNKSLASYDAVAAGLDELRKEFGGVLYPVETTKGMEVAKVARATIREKRFEVERVRQSAKAPLLSIGKHVDTRAREITAAILEIEEPIDQQIKTEEARKEREKQERIAAEQRRVENILARIDSIRTTALRLAGGASATEIQEVQQKLRAFEIDDTFEEFRPQALAAKGEAFIALAALGAAALVRENEKAELERFRAEKAARDALAAANPPPPPPPLVLTPSPPTTFAPAPAPERTHDVHWQKPDFSKEMPSDELIIETVAVSFAVTKERALKFIKQVGRGKKVK